MFLLFGNVDNDLLLGSHVSDFLDGGDSGKENTLYIGLKQAA